MGLEKLEKWMDGHDLMGLGVLVTVGERVVYLNPSAEQLMGTGLRDVLGVNCDLQVGEQVVQVGMPWDQRLVESTGREGRWLGEPARVFVLRAASKLVRPIRQTAEAT